MVIVNQDRGMPDIGLWLYALTQHSMTNRYAALNENMIYHCPHDVVPLYEKRLYSAFQFMHQLQASASNPEHPAMLGLGKKNFLSLLSPCF